MKFRLFLLLLLLPAILFSQTPYGNDWINFSQTYYKIKITEEGVYRITESQLQQAGIHVEQINPKNFQLFNKGIEVPLYVKGEDDDKFDSGDFLEFFGEKNDGKLDKPLYTNPADQPHDYYSLYTDTAVYFLTWTTSTPGKRYTDFYASTSGLQPEPYFMHQSVSYFTDGGYYPGAYILAQLSLSEYTAGEGIFGGLFYPGASQVRAVPTPGFYTGTAPPPGAESYAAGRSNASSTHVQGFNHHLRIEAGNNGSTFGIKKDTLYKGYGIAKNTFALNASDIGSTTYFRLSAVNDLGAQTDYQAPGYIKVTYPRRYDLQGTNALRFNLKGLEPGNRSLLRFSNSSLNKGILLDLTNQRRIPAPQNAGTLEVVVPGAGSNKDIYLYDSTAFKTASLIPVNFINYNAPSADKDFLIVTHTSLLSKAQEYAEYRSQTGYKVLLTSTQQLYDQFYYGIHHPLAIRNFSKYLLEKGAVKPKYLLLMGKGQSHAYVRNPAGLANDLVPGIGNPPSDNMFTSGLDGTRWEPAIATGRIAAKTPEDVDIYLRKLKMYEQQPDSLWRKNIIHVSGGNSLSENLQWSGYQNSFNNEASEEFFGSNSIGFHKNVSSPITDNLREKIVNEINNGVSFLSFFGHGSAQATEINFGEPGELQNQNKLLIYLINGCNAGNPFTETSLGEKMIFQPDKAAIGWLATSDEGIASYLGSFSRIFYRNAFRTNYGSSIAESVKESIRTYQNPNDVYNQAHSREYLWQGDPALKFYSPQKTDYYIENKDLFIYPENTNAASDSFAIAVITKNLGKALNDSLSITVKHILPDNSQIDYPVKYFGPVFNTDTLYYYIKPGGGKLAGNNKFIVTLDPLNRFDELSRNNNTAELNYFMPSNGLNILYPVKNSIVSSAEIELKAQSADLLAGETEYLFEIDTIPAFNSIWKKNSGILKQGFMPVWKPVFTPEDNKVYYWRVRINAPENEGGIWQESAFTFIKNSPEGWGQAHSGQFESIGNSGAFYNENLKKFEFEETTYRTSIQTRGDDAPTVDERTFRSDPGGRRAYHSWEFSGITLLTFIPETMDLVSYPSAYNFQNMDIPGSPYYTGQYFFDLSSAVAADSLVKYIENTPPGYYVIGFTGRNTALTNLSSNVINAFHSIGLSAFETINAGEPYMFWGEKGLSPGMAIEKTADLSSSVPARSQVIKFEKEYYYPFIQGKIISEKIGPAKEWQQAELTVKKEPDEEARFDLIGIKADGQETVLKNNINTVTDIKDIDAVIYPYLKIQASFRDETNRTPAQLQSWKILYTPYPEGTINPSLKNIFHSETVQEGDSIRWQLAYQNISTHPTDSISVSYMLTKSDRSVIKNKLRTYPPLNPGDSLSINLKLPTAGLSSDNSIKLEFQPKNEMDLYSFNNSLIKTFTTAKDDKEPLLDVFFDGRRITNSEIVSPAPVITISVTDENPYLPIADTSAVELSIKQQDDFEFQRVYYSSGKLMFNPAQTASKNKASVEYHPERFADGIYTLRIRSKDASGNFNTANDYEIDFEVVNESAITHFYPYPNPFTTTMHFVFTLTGDKIPDKLKVQIMTVTGKIVREVSKEELGSIRIGNNISEFSWDGTDQFGDRLANGVYFYRVLSENTDEKMKHRRTAGDQYFKKNFGKIYLMR